VWTFIKTIGIIIKWIFSFIIIESFEVKLIK